MIEELIPYCQTLTNRTAPFPAQYMIFNASSFTTRNPNGILNEGNRFHLANYGLTTFVDSIILNKEDVLIASTVAYGNSQKVRLDLTNNVLAASLFIPESSPNTQQIPIVNNDHKISIGTAYLNYKDGFPALWE